MSLERLKYRCAPGHGLMTKTAHELRMKFFESMAANSDIITSTQLTLEQVKHNIESFIGSVEIPLGLAGPLLFNSGANSTEWVYCAIGTSEGALVASINRGAKAISECGGFNAHFVHQKMLRAPVFSFRNMESAFNFEKWIKSNFTQIKQYAAKFSNHAELIEIKTLISGKLAHMRFIYTTCDASGQNMVTHCTWNTCLWIEEQFQKEANIKIEHFYVDGSGSNDKKVSFYSLQNGRGVHVISECFLLHEVIEKTLRTKADDMYKLYRYSMGLARFDGTIGGTINIANSIAGIFAATGQDLASIHESSIGVLEMDKTDYGLYLSLSVPTLVIGTVGGGTHLPGPRTVLEFMKCYGKGKLERFAKIISGFALSLEISTLAALASGQFATAHQKHGKNNPND